MLIAILIINILSLALILSGMRELGMRLTSLEVTLEELLEESKDSNYHDEINLWP